MFWPQVCNTPSWARFVFVYPSVRIRKKTLAKKHVAKSNPIYVHGLRPSLQTSSQNEQSLRLQHRHGIEGDSCCLQLKLLELVKQPLVVGGWELS